jgi:hypothetical protein
VEVEVPVETLLLTGVPADPPPPPQPASTARENINTNATFDNFKATPPTRAPVVTLFHPQEAGAGTKDR